MEKITSGEAYNKFIQMVENQGGDISYLENIEKFEKAKYIIPVKAKKAGTIMEMNAEDIGKVARDLGAGRIRKEDKIDMSAGIVLTKKVNNQVLENDVLAYIHTNDENKAKIAVEEMKNIIKIS